MTEWYYYDDNGGKIGPIPSSELQSLSRCGVISPETVIENEKGQSTVAKSINGLVFSKTSLPFVVTDSVPEKKPTQHVDTRKIVLGGLAVFVLLCGPLGYFLGKTLSPQPTESAQPEPVPVPVEETSSPSPQSLPMQREWPSPQELAVAPLEFLEKVRKATDEINEKDGFAVVGQVFINGQPAEAPTDFEIKLNGSPSFHFNKGWFLFPVRPLLRDNNVTFQAWGAQTNKTNMTASILPEKVNFFKIEIQKTPDDKLVDLTGRVVTEDKNPVANASVYANYSGGSSYGGNELKLKSVETDQEGKYRFPKVFPHAWSVVAHSSIFKRSTYIYATAGSGDVEDIVFYNPRKVTVDTVYQPDGSTDFTKDNVVTDRYELFSTGSGSNDTAKGNKKTGGKAIFDPKGESNRYDLRIEHNIVLQFGPGYDDIKTRPGLYDLGEMDFNLVAGAEPNKIVHRFLPCELNHVYVVRTQEMGHYAKFIVRSIDILEPPIAIETPVPKEPVTVAEAQTVKATTVGVPTPETPVVDASPQFNIRPAQNDWPSASDLATAPADFNLIGQKIADEIKKNNGYAVAGQVVNADGTPLKKGMYRVSVDARNSRVVIPHYDNGWFITQRLYDTGATSCKCVVTTFQHRVEFAQEIVQGKVNFQRIVLEAVPEEELTPFKGKVQDEKNQPVADAVVKLSLDRSTSIEMTTDAQGEYSFPKVLPQISDLSVTSKQHYGSTARCVIEPDKEDGTKWAIKSQDGLFRLEDQKMETTIFSPRRIVIEAVLQPDGSTNFSARNTLKDRFALELFGDNGLIVGSKKTGSRIIFDPTAKDYDDMGLRINSGVPAFFVGRPSGKNSGIYTLGRVDFTSVKLADPGLIQNTPLPCELNHVYVVRTAQNGLFVKFIIRSIIVGGKDGPSTQRVDKETSPAPAAPQPRRINPATAERQIKAALEKNIDLDFRDDATFEDLFRAITDKHPGLNIALDQHGAGTFGITPRSPVVRERFQHSDIKLRVALWLILKEQDLTCHVEHGTLWVTTALEAKEKPDILNLPTSGEALRRINKALDRTIDAEFDEKSTLDDLLHLINKEDPGLIVLMDGRGAGTLGISSASPVVREPVKFKAAKLRNVLLTILPKQDLAYCIKNDVLLITSIEEAKKMTKSD